MLGLRLHTGVSRALLQGKDEVLKMLVKHGLIKLTPERVIATEQGLQVLNQLWLKLV